MANGTLLLTEPPPAPAETVETADRPWLGSFPAGVAPTVDAPDKPIPELFEAVVARCAPKPAMHFLGRGFTYRELSDSAARFARALADMGVGPGDRVALHLPNCPQYAIAFLGTLQCGAAAVQISPLLAAPEIDWCLLRSDAKVLVTMDLLLPAVKAGRAQRRLAGTIIAGIAGFLPTLQRWVDGLWHLRERSALYRDLKGIWKTFDAALRAKGDPPRPTIRPAEDAAVLQPTGGTTGRQKFAVLTHRNLVANAMQVAVWGPVTADDVILAAPPFTHAYGLTGGLMLPLLVGASSAVLPNFAPDAAVKACVESRVTVAPLVPPMAATMARTLRQKPAGEDAIPGTPGRSAPRPLPALRFAICGGAALTPELKAEFEAAAGVPIYQGYGLSEASPVTHCNPVGGDNVPGSIGVPLPGTDARIVRPEGDFDEDVPVGEVGELLIRGPQVMKEYLGGADERGVRDGWLPTGDLARRDERGYFYLTGRRKEMILTNGLNVYPCEVEEVLRRHPCVADAAAMAEPHPQRGEAVKALVVPAEGCRIDPADLIAFCGEWLARYKCPRHIEVVRVLPERPGQAAPAPSANDSWRWRSGQFAPVEFPEDDY